MTRILLLIAALVAACGAGDAPAAEADGPAAAFRRLLEAEAGDDQRAWLECFTKGSLDEMKAYLYDKEVPEGLDASLPAFDFFLALDERPDAMTFAHEVNEGAEEIVEEGLGWVVRSTKMGRARTYWCRVEDGRWRFDYALTLERE